MIWLAARSAKQGNEHTLLIAKPCSSLPTLLLRHLLSILLHILQCLEPMRKAPSMLGAEPFSLQV